MFLGDGETFWNCNLDIWHQDTSQQELETVKDYNLRYPRYANGKYYDLGSTLSGLNWPDIDLYTSLICLFNTRELSFPQDSQAAFSGVLHSLRRGFLGGFVNALPRLFLDSALLWQPCKGQIVRRIHRAGNGMEPDYPQDLPTWSWCSWKCTIDPRSLVFARDFELARHGYSWTLTHLVQWSVMSNCGKHRDDIKEPVMLHNYRSYTPDTTDALPSEWRIKSYEPILKGTWFSHDALEPEDPKSLYPSNEFAYPLPLPESDNNEDQPCNTSWPFLTGCTTSADLRVRCILTPDRMTKTDWIPPPTQMAMISLSVTELPEFTAGPDDCFSVAVLEDGRGNWAGVLRVVETYEAGKKKETLQPGEKAELIALSRGHVSCRILLDDHGTNELSEEQIDNRGWAKFINSDENIQETYTQSHIRFRREGDNDKNDQAYKGGGSVYEFYNVMWVAREQGVLYRRGIGRVCQSIWEKSCSEKEKVVLG